ncbi:MAG: DUF5671 domain-containing protein [Patescibacteria group bacterium]
MENNLQKPKMTAGDFFLHLGVVVVLYVFVGFLLNLLFTVINVAYPPVGSYSYFTPSISFPVAALTVLFPVFILLSWLMYRSYDADMSKKQLGIRKWLTFLTIFVTSGVIIGDFIFVIYLFLDGSDFTAGFISKTLSLFVIALVIFLYYTQDLRDKISSGQRKTWISIALIITTASIVAGFSVLGSPQKQRLLKYDGQKLNDLQSIQGQIIYYYQSKESFPDNLDDLKDPLSGYVLPINPETKESYTYKTKGNLSFELCTNFNFDSTDLQTRKSYPAEMAKNDNWSYKQGEFCFERTIDPELYKLKEASSGYKPTPTY